MSASLLGHGHDGGTTRRLTVLLLAVFVLLWLWAALVYQRDSARPPGPSEREADGRSEVGAATHAEHTDAEHEGSPAHADVRASGWRKWWPFTALSLYRGLQVFHFHDSEWPPPRSVEGHAVRFATAAFALGVPLFLLGWLFRGGLRHWLHSNYARDFAVVVGESHAAKHLAADLLSNGRRVIRVVNGSHAELRLAGGVLMMEGDLQEPAFWRDHVRARAARAIILLEERDADNIEMSLTIEEALCDKRPRKPVGCHIHLSDLHLEKGLMRLLPTDDEAGPLARHYFNRHEIMARLLARQHPLPEALVEEVAVPEHYIIVGFDQLGQNIALKLVKMGQQVVKKRSSSGTFFEIAKPHLTIVDPRGEDALRTFRRSYPGLVDTCELRVIKAGCGDPELLDLSFLSEADARSRCSLIFALDEERTVVSTILHLVEHCPNAQKYLQGIYYRAAHKRCVSHLLSTHQARVCHSVSLHAFAPDAEIYTEDVILNLSLDLMAARIHAQWADLAKTSLTDANPAPAAHKSWTGLTEQQREGNREPADHMWAKLRTLGFRLETEPLRRNGAVQFTAEDEALARKIEEEIEALAGSEHYRWMSWRLIDGWKLAPVRNDARKEHPDLIEYEALSEPAKEKDRVIVRVIPTLLKLGRLRVVRLEE